MTLTDKGHHQIALCVAIAVSLFGGIAETGLIWMAIRSVHPDPMVLQALTSALSAAMMGLVGLLATISKPVDKPEPLAPGGTLTTTTPEGTVTETAGAAAPMPVSGPGGPNDPVHVVADAPNPSTTSPAGSNQGDSTDGSGSGLLPSPGPTAPVEGMPEK